MRAVSDRFLRTLTGSHQAIFRARVCETFQTGVIPDGVEIPILPGGDVTSSASADIRSTLNLTADLKWPRAASDLLMPYGNEIFVERGLEFGDGQKEWVGLGYYRINTPEQAAIPDGPVSLTCSDRMSGIIDAKFIYPRQFPAAMSRAQMVSILILEVFPQAGIEWDDELLASQPIGRAIIAEQDRFATLKDLMTSLGKVGYWDYRGMFVIKTPPSITGTPSWTVSAGTEGVLVRMSRNLTREGVYNVAVVTGEAADTAAPVIGTAADYGLDSPTRYGGRFGPVPTFFSSPLITTKAQAITAAGEILKKSLGLPYQISLGSVPNPAIEVNDVVGVRYPEKSRSRSLLTEVHVIDEVTIPLDVDTEMSMKTREQPAVLIGEVVS